MTICKSVAIKTLFVVALFTQGYLCDAQNILEQEIHWNSSGFTDLISNDVVQDAPCEFVTHGMNDINWIQGNGSFESTISISGANGNWEDVLEVGSMTFDVLYQGLIGKIEFARSNDELTVTLTINGGTAPIRNLYTISSIQ